jgi:hypothetical protein
MFSTYQVLHRVRFCRLCFAQNKIIVCPQPIPLELLKLSIWGSGQPRSRENHDSRQNSAPHPNSFSFTLACESRSGDGPYTFLAATAFSRARWTDAIKDAIMARKTYQAAKRVRPIKLNTLASIAHPSQPFDALVVREDLSTLLTGDVKTGIALSQSFVH